jgi:hypothetical protein
VCDLDLPLLLLLQCEERSAFDLAALDADDGQAEQLVIERRGNKLDVAPIDMWRSATAFTEPGVVDAETRCVRLGKHARLS